MSPTETMRATADAWLTGFKHWNVDELVAPRADDCLHEIYPTTLGLPPSTNADFRAFFEPLKSFKDTEVSGQCAWPMLHEKIANDGTQVKVHAQIFDSEARSWCVHMDMWATTPVGPFHNEFVFMLFFNEEGSKVVRIREMMDSLYASTFFAKMAAYGAQQQGGH